MPPSLLITQCLQNDFVKPLGRHEPLPNFLHVGFEEARRLMGDDPGEGPVQRVMRWAGGTSDEALRIVHIRDWHRAEDPSQHAHLRQFGNHCLVDTEGAAFAFAFDAKEQKHVDVVSSLGLNDFVETELQSLLLPWQATRARVGLMGVWTEAKVSYLAYELRTRYPELEIAVSSALTASSSTAQHFVALDQLEKLLGVRVIASVGEFMEFLTGVAEDGPVKAVPSSRPKLELDGCGTLAETDAALLRYVFRDCRSVRLRSLDGGYSGNLVLGSESVDAFGHRQVPHVVKIGPRALIGRERSAFERIESVLGNTAPQVAAFADLGDRGAIKYRYASMGGGFSSTFQKLYQGGMEASGIERILRRVFEEQLGRLYAAATREKVDLLSYYGFSSTWAPSVRKKVEALGGPPPIEVAGRELPDLGRFYAEEIDALPKDGSGSHYFSYVHGDLNGANIIVDAQANVWIIDFFHTHRGHVLRDLVKLENDLLYIFTPVSGPTELEEALKITDVLLAVADLAEELPSPEAAGLSSPALVRGYETLRFLRSFYPALIHEDRDPLQLLLGQLRYAVHTLSFHESDPLQKKWALATAALASRKITEAYRGSRGRS